MTTEFAHLDERGYVHIVDITGKEQTHRRAIARCRVVVDAGPGLDDSPYETDLVDSATLAEASIAGMFAAKQTSTLIPLCHPIRLTDISVAVTLESGDVVVTVTTETVERTGVEMEALTACAIAALAVVGACSSNGIAASVEDLTLWEKTGGRSGTWRRPPDRPPDGVRPLLPPMLHNREAR